MDAGDIERKAVNQINDILSRCPKLIPYIAQNDKTPSWDGEIYLYSSLEKKKKNIFGTCKVQVKGTYRSSKPTIFNKTISYPIETSDLNNYLRDGGVIYFVVLISSTSGDPYDYKSYKYTTYYVSLLPYDIKRFLDKITPEQKTKSVTLSRFPEDPIQIENIIEDFIFNKGKQYSTYQESATVQFLNDGGQYNIFINRKVPLVSRLPRYVYKRYADNISVAVGKIVIQEVGIDNLNLVVRIDGKPYFHNVHLDITKNNKIRRIILNHGLHIVMQNKTRYHINLKKNSTIDEYIRNLEFMIALKNSKKIDIGGIIQGESPKIDAEGTVLNDELSFFKKIQELLRYLHVKKDVLVSKLTDKNLDDLISLYNTILLGQHLNGEERLEQDLVGTIAIGPYHFFLMRLRKEGCEYILKDPFHDNMNCQMSITKSPVYESSLALWLAVQGYEDADNIDYRAVEESITRLPYCDDLSYAVINFILSFLEKYDCEKDSAVLSCVKSIALWLYECNQSIINHLNLLQCIYRERELTQEEQNVLISYKCTQTDYKILAGINILLNNMNEYRYYLNHMDEKDLSEFKSYPIYNLAK